MGAHLKALLRGDGASEGASCYSSLAYIAASVSVAGGSLLQIGDTSDRISWQRGVFLTLMGFCFFVALTDFFNRFLLRTEAGVRFRKAFGLAVSDVMEITNKLVSAIQALLCFLAGLVVCRSTCSTNFVYASHYLLEAYAWFGTAYFIYDIWSMYAVHTQKSTDKQRLAATPTGGLYDKYDAGAHGDVNANGVDCMQQKRQLKEQLAPVNRSYIGFLKYIVSHPVMMIHHVFVSTFGLVVVTYLRGGGHCIYSYIFMMEISTPFVSLRSILSTLGMKESKAYVVNGLVMIASFFVFRILMWPYVFWSYGRVMNLTFAQSIMGLPKACIASILILFLPQLYWFYLMIKGAFKILRPKAALTQTTAPKYKNATNQTFEH